MKLVNRLTGETEAYGNRDKCLSVANTLCTLGEPACNLFLVSRDGVQPYTDFCKKMPVKSLAERIAEIILHEVPRDLPNGAKYIMRCPVCSKKARAEKDMDGTLRIACSGCRIEATKKSHI